MKNIHIEIKDKNGDVVNEYYVHRLNVRDNMERIKAHREISEMDVSDEIRGHLYTCSSMAVALRDKDGERLFKDVTDDSGEIVKPAYEVFEDEMDFEEYGLLVKHYLEMNPVEASLDAKKKKS